MECYHKQRNLTICQVFHINIHRKIIQFFLILLALQLKIVYLLIYLSIYYLFWLRQVLVAACTLLSCSTNNFNIVICALLEGFALKTRVQRGTALVVQWIRLRAPNAGGPGSIPGQGTRSHMHAATKSSHATAEEPACRN